MRESSPLHTVWIRIEQFNDDHFPGWRTSPASGFDGKAASHWFAAALAGEAGELIGLTKRLCGGGTNRSKPEPTGEQIAEELADVFIYSVLFAAHLGLTSEAFALAVLRKIAKNEERMRPGRIAAE